ncbi:hypothetical protein K5V21_03675 [Clostridium sardiniense]|uniref:DUF1540 domain-containing protein n=1 Tax=Clostridium sardiniense TaxID=29369 RepID=A0ABS7KUT9_CLOSR|nr:hypothetical protein [Clostridium sardiniense]MBY0754550.1 hypothetical protein [Clostridium sardiniense]MDQ0460854.1 hypothetical protein [Clostridium sardiniense]
MCNQVECKWNANGNKCINSDIKSLLENDNIICKCGFVEYHDEGKIKFLDKKVL